MNEIKNLFHIFKLITERCVFRKVNTYLKIVLVVAAISVAKGCDTTPMYACSILGLK